MPFLQKNYYLPRPPSPNRLHTTQSCNVDAVACDGSIIHQHVSEVVSNTAGSVELHHGLPPAIVTSSRDVMPRARPARRTEDVEDRRTVQDQYMQFA